MVNDDPRADLLLCPLGAHCAYSGTWFEHLDFGGPSLLHHSLRSYREALVQDHESGLGHIRAEKSESTLGLVRRRIWAHLPVNDVLVDLRVGIRGGSAVGTGTVTPPFWCLFWRNESTCC